MIAYLKLEGGPQFDRGVAAARQGMVGAAGAAEGLGAALGATEARLAGAGRQSGLASAQSSRLRAAQLSALAAQERFNTALASGSASTARLASAEATLLRANERLRASNPAAPILATSTAAATATGRMTAFRGSMATGIATMGKLGLALGAFELVRKAIDITKEANDFQRAMVQVQTNAGASATEVNMASAALLKMAGPVAAAPAELATAWYHAKSVGLDYAKSIETTRIAAEGARVGHADLEETMNALTSTVASGIPGVKDMSGAMGQLIATVGAGDMKLADLNDALGTGILTRMKQYGLSLTDVGAALATFGDNNIRGADAATLLRMGVEALVKQGKPGQDALARIGLKVNQLRDDIQKGGLNKALLDLNSHLKAAGITGDKVGSFLLDAFTKKGGGGVSILIGQIDRVQTKLAVLRDSNASFGEKWKATTETASFALASLGHRVEAAGIALTAKLGPSIASAATWLGTNLPAAIHTLSDTLGPTVHTVGTALVGAWHGVLMVLGPVVAALGAVGGFLKDNKGLANGLATAVIAMWGAFKLYTIATTALSKVGPALIALGVKAEAAGRFITAGLGPAGMAITILGIALGGAAMRSDDHAAAVQREKDEVLSLTDAIKADSGALGEHSRAVVKDSLQSSGAFDAAHKLGVSLKDLTDAAMGNKTALAAVDRQAGLNAGTQDFLNRLSGDEVRALLHSSSAADRKTAAQYLLNEALNGSNSAVRKAVQASKDAATADGKSADATAQKTAKVQADTRILQWNIDAHGRLVTSLAKAGSAVDNTTTAIQKQTTASQLLKNALDALNGVATSVEQTQDTLTIGLGNLADKSSLFKDANGHVSASLKASTVAGATNRQMLVGLIQNAKDAAQAVADHARQQGHGLPASLKIGNAALKANEDRIRAAAKAAGLNKDATEALIKKLGKLAEIKATPKIELQGTKKVSDKLDALGTSWQLKVANMSADKIRIAAPDTSVAMATVNSFSAWFNQQIADMSSKRPTVPAPTGLPTGPITGGGTPAPPRDGGGGSGHATGGTAGAGTFGTVIAGTTDTADDVVVRVSRGEEIIRASQARKHRRLLKMINSGAAGFASGGTAGGISHVGSDYIYNGHKYASLRAAENAQTSAQKASKDTALGNAQSAVSGIQVSILPPSPSALKQFESAVDHASKALNAAAAAGVDPKKLAGLRKQLAATVRSANKQLGNLRIQVNKQDMHAVESSLKGTAADVRSAFSAMMADARNAGLSASRAASVTRLERSVESHVSTRNRLQGQLGSRASGPTAYDRLSAARDARAQEKASVSGAVGGFFNLSASGTGPNADRPVSFGSMRAQQLQAKATILKWAAGIKKLGHGKLGKSKAGLHIIAKLAEDGPETWPQVEALLGAGSAIGGIIATEAAIEKAASSVGGYVGGLTGDAAVKAAQATVDSLKRQIKTQNDTIEKLDSRIEDGVRKGLEGLKIVIDPQGVAKLVAVGNKRNKRRGGH